jgi:hypothetical protein
MFMAVSLRFAAARKRKWPASLLRRDGVRRTGKRSKVGRDRFHVIFGQSRRDHLHAIRLERASGPVAKPAQLCADIGGAQSEQARYAGLHARKLGSMTACAGRNLPRGCTAGRDRLALPQHILAHFGNRRRLIGRMLRGKVLRDFRKILIRQIGQQVIHRRIMTPSIFEGFELVVEIAGRFAGETREIDVLGAFALCAVARRAGKCAGRHRVRGTLRHLGNSNLAR